MNGEHPAAHLFPSVVELRRRATLTSVAFGAVILARGWDLVAREWSIRLLRPILDDGEAAGPELVSRLEHADRLVNAGSIAVTITFVLTAVVFLRWMHRLVALIHLLGAPVRWEPSQAVWSFFIPFISLVRPYQVLSAAHAALEPEKVAPPGPRVDPTAQVDYRGTAFFEPVPARKLPVALVAPWWAAFIILSIGGRFVAFTQATATPEAVITSYQGGMFVSVAAVTAAALAITVVRGLTARLEERFRRIRESSTDALAEQQIRIFG